ncbi:hypothetical protein [Nocardia testacea]
MGDFREYTDIESVLLPGLSGRNGPFEYLGIAADMYLCTRMRIFRIA